MKHLFEPFQLKGLKLKNRIVMPALASFLFGDEGKATDETIEHYKLRAASGVSMVIVEANAVSPEGFVSPRQARIYDDRYIDGLSKIADTIRSEGAVPAIQLHHGGRQISPRVIKRDPVAPSPLPCPTIRSKIRPLSVEEIQELVKRFGDAAERAVKAGFNLIEIHGAHGYLINQFLSPFSNIREDEYGGDIEGRTRFAKEIVQEIRSRIGWDIPLSFKISAQEFVPNGLTVPEAIEILRILIKAGIDIVQVSAGNDATPEWICQPMYMKRACLAESAAKVKSALRIPVMTVGRINDPLVAEEILAKGWADLVCIGRGILADPEMPKKAKEGRFDEIRRCIACNTCMESIFRRGRIECLVNPTLGREKQLAIRPAEKRKNVMVVGGGPGGLNVAWVAAKRGHRVMLFERKSYLGGQLALAGATAHKEELQNLIRFLEAQVKRFNVECHLNSEVTLETIRRIDPDVVILATGSYPIIPPIAGKNEKVKIITALDILRDPNPEPRKTVVLGGGPTGCETALYLAESGSQVTMIELLPKIGTGIESITRKVLLQKLEEHHVRILTSSKLSKIEDKMVLVKRENGESFSIETERVVIAVGNKPDDHLYKKIKNLGYEVYQIGDCLEPRNAKVAIYEGAIIGRSI